MTSWNLFFFIVRGKLVCQFSGCFIMFGVSMIVLLCTVRIFSGVVFRIVWLIFILVSFLGCSPVFRRL